MPKSDEAMIDTAQFGLAIEIPTPDFPQNKYPGLVEIKFDTGVIIYAPEAIAVNMRLHLQESDPE